LRSREVGPKVLKKAQTREQASTVNIYPQGTKNDIVSPKNIVCCSTMVYPTTIPIIIPRTHAASTIINAS